MYIITRTVIMFTLLAATFSAVGSEIRQLNEFGDNPGNLSATFFKPADNTDSLVVLLHGCGQNAEWLADHTGLLSGSKREQFALLLPQQDKSNNIQLCYNWFSPADHLAGQGETASLINMIETARKQSGANKIYIVGLSAGGAMATSLIAQYPSTFRGAGIIAGVGYPCADTLVKALSCMKSGSAYEAQKLADIVKQLHTKPMVWPNISLFSGSMDAIVSPINSRQMYDQWQLIMNTNASVSIPEIPDGISVERMQNESNKSFIELIMIDGIGHGWPINSQATNAGKAAPFVLESPINVTDYLIDVWGI